jgi:hypothetical protein
MTLKDDPEARTAHIGNMRKIKDQVPVAAGCCQVNGMFEPGRGHPVDASMDLQNIKIIPFFTDNIHGEKPENDNQPWSLNEIAR